jgi:hypothetical protein
MPLVIPTANGDISASSSSRDLAHLAQDQSQDSVPPNPQSQPVHDNDSARSQYLGQSPLEDAPVSTRNGTSTGVNDVINGTSNDCSKGMDGINDPAHAASTTNAAPDTSPSAPVFEPIAICGMACRLPGGVANPQDLWDLIMAKRDAKTKVPETRYNISGYHAPTKKPGLTISQEGYFLDDSVDLAALDTSRFPMSRAELEGLDPQQRILLEVAKESLDDAGETATKGKNVGVFVGTFGNDWYDLMQKESQRYGTFYVTNSHDFAISNRVSHEMDLRGPRYEPILRVSPDLSVCSPRRVGGAPRRTQ